MPIIVIPGAMVASTRALSAKLRGVTAIFGVRAAERAHLARQRVEVRHALEVVVPTGRRDPAAAQDRVRIRRRPIRCPPPYAARNPPARRPVVTIIGRAVAPAALRNRPPRRRKASTRTSTMSWRAPTARMASTARSGDGS